MIGSVRESNAIITIAYRDVLKFLRDPSSIISTVLFPLLFVGMFGVGLQAAFGSNIGYNYLTFIFLGVLAQTLFQSTALGLISLIEDRQNDFAQEMFISPISRYSLVFGKIVGESIVSMLQGIVIIAFGAVIGVQLSWAVLPGLFLASLFSCLLGGAFGLIVLSGLSSQRTANQIFPFLIFPQFFLAGVFSPLKGLPLYLDIASKLAPLRYAVDLTRAVYYQGQPATYQKVVIASPAVNLLIMAAMFAVFFVGGTMLFVRSERNK